MDVKLIGGANPEGSVLYSMLFLATQTNSWHGSLSLGWVLVPGDYTLVFSSFDGFSGWMQ